MKLITLNPLVLLLAAGTVLLHGCATSEKSKPVVMADDTRAYFELLRSDFNGGKIRALNQTMKLTVAEADKFWPIYRRYEKELAGVGDRKLALIRDFLVRDRDGTLDDPSAKELSEQWLKNAADRLDLWKQYQQQISAAVSPLRAAQFLQVENQMAIFVDLAIASEMPAVGGAANLTK